MAVDTISRGQLLDELRLSGEQFVAAVRGLSPEWLAEGRYEEGWTGRDIVAHIASIEWTYPRLFALAEEPPGEARDARKRFRGGIDGYNARQVTKRAGNTIDELLEEFERNRAATITAVEEVDEELLHREVTAGGGTTGPAVQVLHSVAVLHVLGHLNDITNGESS